MSGCEKLKNCDFFNKYNETINETCDILIQNYCLGKKKNLCKRLIFFTETNTMPSPDMAPNGMDLSGGQEDKK